MFMKVSLLMSSAFTRLFFNVCVASVTFIKSGIVTPLRCVAFERFDCLISILF